MSPSVTPLEYRPARWLTVVAIAASVVFAFSAVHAFATEASVFFRVFLTLGTFAGVGGIAETRVARVELRDDCVFIANLLDTHKLAYSQIEAAKLGRGVTALRLESGERWRLPLWLGADASLSDRINERIEPR
jgi:hypothetical protein